ncbi:MAG: alpha/beta fold hydrolase [Polyangiaceae bacterium]
MKSTLASPRCPRAHRGWPSILMVAAALTGCQATVECPPVAPAAPPAPAASSGPFTPITVVHPAGAYVAVGDVKLWVEVEGTGEPLVLVAGGPGQSHYFHPFFSVLTDVARMVSYDAFGRGKSDQAKSLSEYTFERDVEMLEGLRKALGFERWAVLGHSYGGMVAQGYAIAHPDRVTKLILANTFIDAASWQVSNEVCTEEIRNLYPEIWDEIQAVRARGLLSNSPEHQKAFRIPSGLCTLRNPEVYSKLPKGFVTNNWDLAYTIAGADGEFTTGGSIAGLDFRPRLKDLKMPMLVIAGRYDRLSTMRMARLYKTHAPQARFVVFEDGGHIPFLETPDELFTLLRAFLTGKPLPTKP